MAYCRVFGCSGRYQATALVGTLARVMSLGGSGCYEVRREDSHGDFSTAGTSWAIYWSYERFLVAWNAKRAAEEKRYSATHPEAGQWGQWVPEAFKESREHEHQDRLTAFCQGFTYASKAKKGGVRVIG